MEANCSTDCPLYTHCSSAIRIFNPDDQSTRMLEGWTLPSMDFLNKEKTYDYEAGRQRASDLFFDQPETLGSTLAGIEYVELTSLAATEAALQAHEKTRKAVREALDLKKQRYNTATKFIGFVGRNGCDGLVVKRKFLFRKEQSCGALVDEHLKDQVQKEIDEQESIIRQGIKDGLIIRRR